MKKSKKSESKELLTTSVEKLELLLNKVVEFNNPDVAYYKGFLYKDARKLLHKSS
jgi:hypothetical protein